MTRLFITAFLQEALILSGNTYFISKMVWVGVAACGFGISYLWTLNVKKVADTKAERLAYSSGAMLGGVFGLGVSYLLSNART